jgi:hypothetical protein
MTDGIKPQGTDEGTLQVISAMENNKPSSASRFSRFGTLMGFLLALIAFILAPVTALQWSARPFPGFLVEQTLVIPDIAGSDWTGLKQGLHYPMRVIRLDGTPIINPAAYAQFFTKAHLGQRISVTTIQPDGSTNNFPAVELIQFPPRDLLRLFWLSYLVGLIYLFLGIWIYRLRGGTAAGRAFAYFCACAAIVNALIFNVWTAHTGTLIWTFAVAQLGGALIGLSVLVPEEIPSVMSRNWVRNMAYGVSLVLSLWGIALIYNLQKPWAYVIPWGYSYLYAAIGFIIFIFSMLLRLRVGISPIVRRQVRIILLGGLLAFTPIGVWFLSQYFSNITFNPLYFSLILLIFPISIAFAMLRYRMWDFEPVIRRTIIYTTLTVLLVLTYLLLVIGLDRVFERYLGESNLFNVIATIVIVAIFTPLRKLVQRVVDKRLYRRSYLAEQVMQEFEEKLRSQVDLDQLSEDLVHVIQGTLYPETILFWAPKESRGTGDKNV